jgi:YHS domain-containing protein
MGEIMKLQQLSLRNWLFALMFAALPFTQGFAQNNAPASPTVALKGYDTVAYFTDKRPVMGTAQNGYEWDGARYLFSSVKNREAFAANPDRYTPQFGGLCATGLGMGQKAAADPNVWKIVDGKLYVFSSLEAKQMADKDPMVLAHSHQAWKGRK